MLNVTNWLLWSFLFIRSTPNLLLFTDFSVDPPARMTYAVKELPKGGLVEVEALAVVGCGKAIVSNKEVKWLLLKRNIMEV